MTPPTSGPILMSGAMVRAVLREIERPGTGKTQTRRIIKPRGNAPSLFDGTWTDDYVLDPGNAEWRAQDIRFFPGQLLWVRETWTARMTHGWTIADARSGRYQEEILYRADGHESIDGWWPSIHMPREFSRLTLEVTGVKIERLRDISEEDAKTEGIRPLPLQSADDPSAWWEAGPGFCQARNARASFAKLWTSINGPGSWEANPFVVAVSFTPRLKNIDQFETRKDAQ